MAKDRKYFICLSSGKTFEISALDFNNLQGRINTGRGNNWYTQRAPVVGGEFQEWSVNFKDIATVYSDGLGTQAKNKDKSVIDIDKRLPPKVGKKEEVVVETCSHSWDDPETFNYVTQVVNGINRYYKQCPKCEVKSPLIKKREVEIVMENKGKTLEDVPEIKG
jgi:hypothetical protein